jgi:site-specific DNA recombinase
MKPAVAKPQRCAIYTRKSTEHNLDLEFNSLDAQREACEAYIKSQAHEGWRLIPERYDDGGLSGASLDRPALQNLLANVRAGKVTVVVVYKVDRLTRSLADFAKLVELFDQYGCPSCRSPRRSTRLPAWAGSPSMCCSPLPSSSVR